MKRSLPRRAAVVVVLATSPACGWLLSSPLSRAHDSAHRAGRPLVGCAASAWTPGAVAQGHRLVAQPRSSSARDGGVCMQVWSNPQAVQDYQDLLDGKAPEDKSDGPSVIIGAGRLGTALANMGMGEDVIVRRGDSIPDTLPASSGKGEGDESLTEFPIYVCVPEGEVAGVIDGCPAEKRQDLVFLQSGCLEPLLKSRGLCRPEQTQATLYFGVRQVGAKPKEYLSNIGIDGRGQPKYAGESAVCGKWSGALAQRLESSEFALKCIKVFYLEWRRVMFEKLIFDCAVNVVGALHKFENVGYITKYHTEELVDMLFELKNTLRGTLAVSLMNGYPERLLAYGGEADGRPTQMDEEIFTWYNKFFWDISQLAIKRNFGDPCPMHTEYLEYGKEKGILKF